MESKYYTPEIEEFHVGFEYEILNDPRTDNGWDKEVVDENSTLKYFNGEHADYRVKYLDREDIESLGWLHTGKWIDDWFKWEQPVRLESGHRVKFIMHYGYHDHKLTIKGDDGGSETCFFEGYVNNKSEFKKVMKQLTIN
jgi:hypothetical protein